MELFALHSNRCKCNAAICLLVDSLWISTFRLYNMYYAPTQLNYSFLSLEKAKNLNLSRIIATTNRIVTSTSKTISTSFHVSYHSKLIPRQLIISSQVVPRLKLRWRVDDLRLNFPRKLKKINRKFIDRVRGNRRHDERDEPRRPNQPMTYRCWEVTTANHMSSACLSKWFSRLLCHTLSRNISFPRYPWIFIQVDKEMVQANRLPIDSLKG